MPWTKATEAFEKAIPACSDPAIIASRAARLPDSAQAVRKLGQIARIAASAMPSEKGLASRDT